jgi:hypothetical protein
VRFSIVSGLPRKGKRRLPSREECVRIVTATGIGTVAEEVQAAEEAEVRRRVVVFANQALIMIAAKEIVVLLGRAKKMLKKNLP